MSSKSTVYSGFKMEIIPPIYALMKSNHENAAVLLGRRIRSLRTEKGWTQQELGDHAEVNYKFVGEIERGQQNPSLNVLVKIAAALGVDLLDLFRYEQEITDRKEIEKRIGQTLQNIPDEELKRIFLIIHALCPAHAN
jgi:transcriptional regulator with XRE-family HTH domain